MSQPFRPMLAAREIVRPEDLHTLQYPMWGTPKKDGIRAQVFWDKKTKTNRMFSRKHLPIPNCHIEEWCAEYEVPVGCDGELVVQGRFGDEDFHECQSKIMSNITVPFKWTYYVFDQWWDDMPGDPGYRKRFKNIAKTLAGTGLLDVVLLKPIPLLSPEDVIVYEKYQVDVEGNEGIILRSGDGHYKQGRCTLNEQLMLKMKRFESREAKVIDFIERKHNANKQTRDKVGAAKRSKHKANLHGMNTLGALVGRDLETGVEFKCAGFTDEQAQKIWNNKMDYYEKIFTYDKQIHGEKDKPRSPQFKGFRSLDDL